MRFVIVTGMSGAGKSTALNRLEDMGYFCVDNLPISLISKFAEMAYTPGSEIQRVALGVDVRSGEALGKLEDVLEGMAAASQKYEILFLDAADEVLVKRYKETRRTHPLARGGRVDRGIAQEREKLAFLKRHADYIIDTSKLLTRELNMELEKIFVEGREFKSLVVTVLSFGFKYGIPADADLVFDVRFLPNPYYLEELRPKTGNDPEIQQFVVHELHRGATLYPAVGGLGNQEQTEVVTILEKSEYAKLLAFIHETDQSAFVTVSTVSEVIGEWNKHKKNRLRKAE